MNDPNQWFRNLEKFLDVDAPKVIGETAFEYFRGSFRRKAFDKKPWPLAKKQKRTGSLMIKDGILMGSVQIEYTRPGNIRIRAGGSRAPYAKTHNQGGTINRAARSENFVRNRYKRGRKSKYFGGMGAFRQGTSPGAGLTFKAYKIKMPQRQFIGPSAEMNEQVKQRLKGLFNNR